MNNHYLLRNLGHHLKPMRVMCLIGLLLILSHPLQAQIVIDPTGSSNAGGDAPANGTYLVQTANAALTAERVVTDTATITWDFSTVGQAKANAATSFTCADTRVVFADGDNIFGCDSGLTYNKTTDVLTSVGGVAATGLGTSYIWASSTLPITDVPLSNGGLLAGNGVLGTPAYITAVSTTPSGSSLYPSTIQIISGFGTLTSPTTVANGDIVGNIQLGGRGSTAWDFGAYLYGYVDGVVSGNTVPLGFQFWTGSDNSTSQQTLTLRASGTAEFIGDVQTASGKSFIGKYTSSGPTLSVANVGANSCGTTAATVAGNANSFEVTVGATAGTQCRVTLPAAPTRWNCVATDTSTAALARANPVDTTHVDLLGAFTAADVIGAVCSPR